METVKKREQTMKTVTQNYVKIEKVNRRFL